MYNKEIDEKWQKQWENADLYKFDENSDKPKYYMVEMFSYPSGAKLHIGHWYNYALCDTFARLKKMSGYNLFHPMGFDSFGLPAENYAIKTGIHPKDSTEENIRNMKDQLRALGASFNWEYTLSTHSENYYKWTQWLFLQLYKHGLAYRKMSLVNWCPKCNTVLANEQVINGKCERCDSVIERKKLKQWFFKITDYSEQLLNDLNKLDWPEKTKKIQTNWIGKSKGAIVKFKLEEPLVIDGEKIEYLETFTTRVDTLFGITFLSIAPEGDIAQVIATDEYKDNVKKYINESKKVSELERQFTDREKTGEFTGKYVIHPLTGKKIPVYVADYVIEGYGSGAVMGVPAHDGRDFDFAKKKGLDIIRVVKGNSEEDDENKAYSLKECTLINSEEFTGLDVLEGQKAIVKKLESLGLGEFKTNYKLKDWLVSRQRYWGTPIPIIYCDHCGTVPVPEKDLPVKLPYNVEFKPDGESPLAKCKEFINCTCPKCGEPAKREADTLDTFVCSSWYELRYPSANIDAVPFDKEITKKMLPVDKYVGGAEHAAMHLIYTRFITKVLRDLGYVDFDESFPSLKHQGLILGPDGNKMSKSKGNTIAPDEFVDKYGADTLRMYIMFAFAFEEGGPWDNNGIKSMSKYINRVDSYIERLKKHLDELVDEAKDGDKDLDYAYNYALKEITKDVNDFAFNTAIARLMELTNELIKYENEFGYTKKLFDITQKFIVIFSIFAPHFGEEIWHELGNDSFVYTNEWPKVDESKLIKDTFKLPVQINGKVRDVLEFENEIDEEKIKEQVMSSEKIKEQLKGKEIVKEIYIKGRIYNIVIK